MMKYRIDKTKNIGTVIFVVEGGRPDTGGTELRLLKAIFADILGYEVQELRRGTDEFIGHGTNPYSRVFALNLPKNQLTQMTDDALDELYRLLRDKYSVKPEDCPIFFLYDRDYKSYEFQGYELKNHYVRRFTDPYGNARGDQGQLLLSYPSVESYLLSCVHEDVFQRHYLLGKDIKADTASEELSTASIQSDSQLTHAAEEMDKGLNAIGIGKYSLDALGSTLIDVFKKQEEIQKSDDSGGFSALSLLSMALLELGILIGEDAELFQ